MQEKVIFIGTDLHGKPSELASKIVNSLREISSAKVISIENRKERKFGTNESVVPKFFNNDALRKVLQAILLPFYLIFSRAYSSRLFSFWIADKTYHLWLFRLAKLLRYRLVFTIISGLDKNYSNLKIADVIVCQSNKMYSKIRAIFPNKRVELIYPWTDLEIFTPAKKSVDIFIPSIPYKIKDFDERGINNIIKVLQTKKFSSKIVFRSQESYDYFSNLKLGDTKLINKILEDYELAKEMANSKVMPLLYKENVPDMPLSAVEGLACGCALICSSEMGISEIVKKEGCGFLAGKDLVRDISRACLNSQMRKKSRKVAEKLFDKKRQTAKYLKLFKEV